ncbi:MAG: endonuclease domain-containing protein [Deltaproteobacteria bacterium]|nr:endonuclease domain-containing protein [Deltaproteobacteria bacterium]
MPLRYDARLKPFARQLRSNLTDAERRLWHFLRGKQIRGVQFYRQKPIGPDIVDFYAPTANLVVEVDGGQHYDDEAQRADTRRTRFLNRQGLKVIRFTNIDVMQNLDGVLEVIFREVSREIPPDPPFSKGGGRSEGGT